MPADNERAAFTYFAKAWQGSPPIDDNTWLAKVRINGEPCAFMFISAKDESEAARRARVNFWHHPEAWANIDTLTVRRGTHTSRSWLGEDDGSGWVSVWVAEPFTAEEAA